MGNRWYEWSRLFFTVTGQCVIVGYLVMAAVFYSLDMTVGMAVAS